MNDHRQPLPEPAVDTIADDPETVRCREFLATLRQPQMPDADLWPAIEARLTPRAVPAGVQRPLRRRERVAVVRFGLAASLLIAVGAGIVEMNDGMEAPPPVVPTNVETVAAVDPVSAARRVLLANVGIADQAESTLQRAVAEEPHDARLRHLLHYAQDQRERLNTQLASL